MSDPTVTLTPTEHDPFAVTLTPVSHDPFAVPVGEPSGQVPRVLGAVGQGVADWAMAPGRVAQGQRPQTPGMWSDVDEATRQANAAAESAWGAQTAMNMAGTGTPFAQAGAAGTFGGKLAKTADQAMLVRAQEMAKAGASREDIWNQTRWFQGADKQWRFEIPDVRAGQVQRNIDIPHERAAVGDVRVGDVFAHKDLNAAYPDLSSYRFSRDPGYLFAKGSFGLDELNPAIKKVAVESMLEPAEQRLTMLHELQHGVQEAEGFAEGANPSMYQLTNAPENPEWSVWNAAQQHPLMQEYNTLHSSPQYQNEVKVGNELWRLEYQPKMLELDKTWVPRSDAAAQQTKLAAVQRIFDDYTTDVAGRQPTVDRADAVWKEINRLGLPTKEPRRFLDAMEAYRRTAGEVEARNVQSRADLTSEQRRAAPPWTTEDVPAEQQIVRFGASGPQMSAEPPQGIRAYHGSPHDFDRFDLSKIGTGEGAQAYGHGLYFAEAEPTAKSYRDALAPQRNLKIGEEALQNPGFNAGATRQAYYSLVHAQGDIDRAIQRAAGATNPEEVQGILRQWKEKGVSSDPGKMYEVNIAADPSHFLDWDKPLSEQHPKVRGAFAKIMESVDPKEAEANVRSLQDQMTALAEDRDPVTNRMRDEPQWHRLAKERDAAWNQWNAAQSGAKAYEALQSASAMRQSPAWEGIVPNTNRRAAAADVLRDAGIPGIKYLDQGSRVPQAQIDAIKTALERAKAKGDEGVVKNLQAQLDAKGTSNYVVFSDDLISILRKYGLAGLIGGGAAHFSTNPAGHDSFAEQ